MSENIKKPFAIWTVDGVEYRLKLRTADICALEQKIKGNLMEIVMGNGIPMLSTMLVVIHRAMQWQHSGIKEAQLYDIFDKYTEENGTQLTLFSDVIIPLMSVSGFFTSNQIASMEEKMEQAQELM